MFNSIKNYRIERARRKLEEPKVAGVSFKSWRLAAIFAATFLMAVLVYAICFFNKPVVVPQVVPNKVAQLHVVSPFEFTYVSELQTQAKRDLSAERIPPLYKINENAVNDASAARHKFVNLLNDRQADYDLLDADAKKASTFFDEISSTLSKNGMPHANPDDIRTVFEKTTPENREKNFRHASFFLRNILRAGVYADGDPIFEGKDASLLPKTDIEPSNNSGTLRAFSESHARHEFLDKLKTLGMSDSLVYAMYRILNPYIVPNIEFDAERTKIRRDEERKKVQPVVVRIREGETLIDSNSAITPIVNERIKAYKNELTLREGKTISRTSQYVEFVMCLLLMMMATLFLTISKTQKNKQPHTILVFCTLLLINLGLERAIIHFGNAEYFDNNTTLLQIFTYCTPVMLGPVIQVLLYGSYTGFVMAIVISALTTMMIGESVVFFVLFLASALVAIYFCDGATSRYRVIFGGIIYGLFISAFSTTIGLVSGIPFNIVWRQGLLAVGAGALTGLLSVAVLPLIETLFKRNSNISLLDYTDLNNKKARLLKILQIKAPGTYHHSVMVSYLAEAAAAAVNANPMVCRVGALYHDIGKIAKPEFFSENQGGGRNLHDEQTPSMSALIIKNHVLEGVARAKVEKMPQQIIEAIRQHHGTSIISYFYNKAMKNAGASPEEDPIKVLRDAGIDETTYRHEGRKPQNVENAIIMIADSCEAASRSLKKITKHGVEELVNAIVRGKMNDGQLDECPITVKQLSKIKKSITYTMMNMLHTRVEYNNAPK